jgi:predicted nucleic acid-binding protein
MPEFDVASALRWARREPKALLCRKDDQLAFVREGQIAGAPLLLDTCVYIHQLQGKLPQQVESIVATREINHSAVAVQELAHTLGALDPRDWRTPSAIKAIRQLLAAMPAHRTFAPDIDLLGRAAILSGKFSRLAGLSPVNRRQALQDATLYLQALKLGFTVLTANISDFDRLQQLVPEGRVLFYRQTA